MVWVLESPLSAASPHQILLEGPGRFTDAADWIDHIVSNETKRLNGLGRKVLPLKVGSCDMLLMRNTCKSNEACTFNRVNCATAFDFSKVSSIEVGPIDQCLEDDDGETYFCALCLLLVKRSGGEDAVLLCPFVHRCAGNLLKFWAFVNTKNEAQYLVRSNIRQGSAMVPYQLPGAEPEPEPNQCRASTSLAGTGARKGRLCINKNNLDAVEDAVEVQAKIRLKWARLSLEERVECLVIDDPGLFQSFLASLSYLFETSSKTSAMIQHDLEGLPLLASLELERKATGQQALSISEHFLRDVDAFWAILEGLCPELFSGRCRCRQDHSEWSKLMAKASLHPLELQLQLAHLVEQQLWELADGACAESEYSGPMATSTPEAQKTSKKRRQRRKNKSGSGDTLDSQSTMCSSGTTDLLPVEEPMQESTEAQPAAGWNTSDLQSSLLCSGVTELQAAEERLKDLSEVQPVDRGDTLDLQSPLCSSGITELQPGEEPLQESSEMQPALGWRRRWGRSRPQVQDLSLVEASHADAPSSFIQPPGLEVDDASLVQRIWEKNQLLVRCLAEANLKISVQQLIQESVLAQHPLHLEAAPVSSY